MGAIFNQLLRLLADSPTDFISSCELAKTLSVSQRTVFRYINLLIEHSSKGGFRIESRKGCGYRLSIFDQDLFDRFCADTFEILEHNIVSDIALAILVNDGARLDDLAERFNYSRSNISRLVSQIEEQLTLYNIRFDSKAYKGLQILGNELSIRAAIVENLGQGRDLSQVANLLGIKTFDTVEALSVLEEVALNEGIYATVEKIQQFLYILLVFACRISRGRKVSFDHLELPQGLVLSAPTIADKRLQSLTSLHWLPALHDEGEKKYISLAFEQIFFDVSKQRQRLKGDPEFYKAIVQSAFQRMQQGYNVNFSQDEVLLNGLLDHVASSYGRYFIGQDLPNPYAEAVQSRYPLAHYCTLDLAEEITNRTQMPLLKGEIGYLTLHIASALVRNTRTGRIPVAILCSTSFGTAELLKTRLSQQYKDLIHVVGVYSLADALNCDLPVALYISTVPVEFDSLHGKPLLQLSPFLDNDHIEMLDAALAELEDHIPMRQFFRPDHFFYLERPAKKERVLEAICSELIRLGDLTTDDKQAVLAREAMVSTEIFPLVAMPHPSTPVLLWRFC